MKKRCEKHGEFKDVYWGDAELYQRFSNYCYDERVMVRNTEENKGCPFDCGLCGRHRTTTILGIIDITNKCNKNCPICFANANKSGYIYQPTMEQIEEMMKLFRSEILPCPAIEFSGGEPTIRKDFLEIIATAMELGFEQVQVATNGKKFAQDIDFCIETRKAGLNSIYLQFDGFCSDNLKRIRGYDDLSEKLQCIENCRTAGINITLVPTVVKGQNESEIGKIIKFALANADIVHSVVFQPISFVGRIKGAEPAMRITVPEILADIEEQTKGQVCKKDFYPLNLEVPIAKFLEKVKRRAQPKFTLHPHCGAGTQVFVNNGDIVPVSKFLDVEKMIRILTEVSSVSKEREISAIEKIKLGFWLNKVINKKEMPKNLRSGLLKSLMKSFLVKGGASTLRRMHVTGVTIAVMHFQDAYNFDLERVQRCGLHYATPDHRIIPFCSYNTIHRTAVEKAFSRPIDKKTKYREDLSSSFFIPQRVRVSLSK